MTLRQLEEFHLVPQYNFLYLQWWYFYTNYLNLEWLLKRCIKVRRLMTAIANSPPTLANGLIEGPSQYQVNGTVRATESWLVYSCPGHRGNKLEHRPGYIKMSVLSNLYDFQRKVMINLCILVSSQLQSKFEGSKFRESRTGYTPILQRLWLVEKILAWIDALLNLRTKTRSPLLKPRTPHRRIVSPPSHSYVSENFPLSRMVVVALTSQFKPPYLLPVTVGKRF